MAVLSARLACISRNASLLFAVLIAGFALSGSAPAQAGTLNASLASLGALEPQRELARPGLLPDSFGWRRHSRLARIHAALARIRHARARRIRAARIELANMARRGQEFCLATAVYFEARDEPIRGQHAVAAVILARTHTPGRPKTVCGVVFQGAWRKTGCQFSFACDGRPDKPHWYARWLRAKQSAAYVWRHQRGMRHIVRGATFYHTKFVHPRWDRQMVRVAHIGLHYFYRPRRGRYS
jgi:cell wall hydrolase